MNKGTVLSVDDDKDLQTVLGQYLENEGYTFETANNGQQLTEKLDSVNLDLVLLDLVLPDADGVNLIGQIRAKTKAPIVVLSGKSDTTEKIICLEMGADDYMTKPFEMRELAARIKVALRHTTEKLAVPVTGSREEAAEKKPEKVEFGTFVLDHNQYQVFDHKNQSLGFTTGEFELLDALISAPNRALSREQLFERTRDSEYDSFDRAIDIQIGRIRKKLGSNGDEIIKTVRGVGYMFCPPEES